MNKASDTKSTFSAGLGAPLKFFAFILVLALVIAAPLTAAVAVALGQKEQYAETYYAALKLKYDRLTETDEAKLVVIGGSSVAFGIDSETAEAELGMPCVNFGLYAAFGLKCMLDLSLSSLGDGDVVVVAPEYSSQMFSEYVGYEYLLQACEGRPSMLLELGYDYLAGLLSKLPAHTSAKRDLEKNGALSPEGVYALSAFDKYGDVSYDRPENVMDNMVSAANLPEITPDIVTDSFADMINEYVAAAERRGATVYFGFCPVNEKAVDMAESVDKAGFVAALEAKLDCPVIASLDDHIMDAGYFYDSNFHMNNAGAIYNTVLLVNDLKRISGDMSDTVTKIPDPPESTVNGAVISSGETGGLKYDITLQGAVITGLSDEGLAMSDITVPEQIENASVYKISSGAFANCAAQKIVLPATVKVMSTKLFDSADNLKSVILNATALPEVGDGLLDGAPSDLKIYVPDGAYGNYVTNYFWTRYSSALERQTQ